MEKVIKDKNDEYLNYYSNLEDKIESIISIANLENNNNQLFGINKYNCIFEKNKNSIVKICKYIDNLSNINCISFWIKNITDINNIDLITIQIPNLKLFYKIVKNNEIYLLIKNNNNLQKIKINIDKWSLLVINLQSLTVYLNNCIIYEGNIFNDKNNKKNKAKCTIYNDKNFIVKKFMNEIILYNDILYDDDVYYLYNIFIKLTNIGKI